MEQQIEIPTKDKKAKYRRELRSALKDILINDFGITKESIREFTKSYIKEVVDNKTKSTIESITSKKIDVTMRQLISEHVVDCRIYSTQEKLKYIYDNLNSIFSCIFKNISLEDTYVSFTSLEHVFKDSWYCLVLDNTTHPIDECKINREDL